MVKARYNSLNGLRTIGALSIVSVHVLKFLYPHTPFNGIWGFLSIGEWAVELFFMISAFAMCCGYYDKIKNNNISLNDFYKKRYKRTLPFWGLMLFIGVIASPTINNLLQLCIELPLTFNLCFYPNLSLLQVGWFLGMIFTFYMIFPFFVFMIWTKKRAWMSLIITMILSTISTYWYKNVEGWDTFSTVGQSIIVFSPRFVAGALIYLYKDTIALHIKNAPPINQCLFRILLLTMIGIAYYIMTFNSLILNAFIVLLLLYSVSFEKYPILDNKITKVISDVSMEIYLSHMFIFRCLEMFHLTTIIESVAVNYLVILFLVFWGAFIFSYVVKFYVLPFILNSSAKIKSLIG